MQLRDDNIRKKMYLCSVKKHDMRNSLNHLQRRAGGKTIAGRPLEARPRNRGIHFNNGKKTVIK
jgi:hypothetical protein